ncbi:hypothetical protein FQ087_00455 [Sporosarcina sp. ANT_H38]|uniref:hypothetical protein n=1 Tax=Sporosarcina sp. ANT_H38 TaxID=2597358 RepID=UPI0011F20AB7|nr:hypothetical protein [Sporosarcina sp. ANT_H38]KAA0964838.1 hypothetical protein FQ087_00455 [Sporosarcina sp. ANT_H38]
MKLKSKIILLLATVLLLYGGLYILNYNAAPKVKLIDAKYLPTETLKDLELESELIVKAVKVDEDNKVIVTTSSSDTNIKYEEPITLSTFKIEEIYYDETNTFQESDKIVVEEFAGYTRNSYTGRNTLIIPKEYTLTKQDHTYVLF